MKHGAVGLLVEALALVGLASTPGRALAHHYEAPPSFQWFTRSSRIAGTVGLLLW
jgi:hypothetical protein